MINDEERLFVDLKDQHTVDITFKELTRIGPLWIEYCKFHGLL